VIGQSSKEAGMQTKVRLLVLALLIASADISLAQDLGRGALIQSDGWRPAGIAWLVRDDELGCRPGHILLPPGYMLSLTMAFQANSGYALQDNTDPSALKRIGIYSLEFGCAALGTCVTGAGAVSIYRALETPDPSNEILPFVGLVLGLSTPLFTSPVLSATGAYFGGKLVGQKGSFWHTLVGSLAGGTVGTAGAYGYGHFWSSRHSYWGTTQNVVAAGCIVIPTALGAVISYNVWR